MTPSRRPGIEVFMARTRAGRNRKLPKRSKTGGVGKKNGPAKQANADAKQSTRKLDRVSRKFDAGVETLRGDLDVVGDCLYELLAAEAGGSAAAGSLSWPKRASCTTCRPSPRLWSVSATEALPPSLVGVERYAAHAVFQSVARSMSNRPTNPAKRLQWLRINSRRSTGRPTPLVPDVPSPGDSSAERMEARFRCIGQAEAHSCWRLSISDITSAQVQPICIGGRVRTVDPV